MRAWIIAAALMLSTGWARAEPAHKSDEPGPEDRSFGHGALGLCGRRSDVVRPNHVRVARHR